MENLRKYLETRIANLKASISKAEDRLYDANKAETELIARRGWGYGMRHSKIGFSTTKSDRIQERIASLRTDLDKLQKTLDYVKQLV